jgi:hypothetical protein
MDSTAKGPGIRKLPSRFLDAGCAVHGVYSLLHEQMPEGTRARFMRTPTYILLLHVKTLQGEDAETSGGSHHNALVLLRSLSHVSNVE